MSRKRHYEPRRTAEQAVEEKMRVLKDFYVVDQNNADDIRRRLKLAIADEPNTDFDIVLDRVAKTLIAKRFGG